jgi:rod shape-determining protein MreD
MLTMLVVQRLILQITMVDQPALGLELLRWLVTLAAYPLVAGFSLFAFGLRRAATGEVDAFGQRL